MLWPSITFLIFIIMYEQCDCYILTWDMILYYIITYIFFTFFAFFIGYILRIPQVSVDAMYHCHHGK